MKLTFERIKKECEPMKHLLVDERGNERLYLGFNRYGSLITDAVNGEACGFYHEYEIKDWTIKEYKPTRKVNAWEWYDDKNHDYDTYKFMRSIREQHPDLEIEVSE